MENLYGFVQYKWAIIKEIHLIQAVMLSIAMKRMVGAQSRVRTNLSLLDRPSQDSSQLSQSPL